MKQVVRRGLKEIVVDEVPDPVVQPHHLIIKTHYSLISSGTETASIHRSGIAKEVAENPSHLRTMLRVARDVGPRQTFDEARSKLYDEYSVLGYSGCGIVVDKHPSVTDLSIGDAVCYAGEGTGHAESILASRNLVALIPPDVPMQHACFATLGSIALNCVRNSQIELGETVAVIGLGLVGQLVAQLARLQGARVIGIDLRGDRVRLSKELGTEYSLTAGERTFDELLTLTGGRGADCVFIAAAAKSSAPCEMAVKLCRDRGRIVVAGAVEMKFSWYDLYIKEINLVMSRAYGPGSYDPAYEKHGKDYPISYVRWTENRNIEEFLRLLSTSQVRVGPLITDEFALEDAPKAYETIMDEQARSLAVLLRYSASQTERTPMLPASRKVFLSKKHLQESGTVGLGVLGAGNLTKWQHLPEVRRLVGARLRAIHSSSGARGMSYARRFHADYCTTDLNEVFRDEQIKAVLIATRNPHHASQAIAALEAGKHVFVEKPMALTEQECKAVFDAVHATGKQLFVGFNRRFSQPYTLLKRALSDRKGPAVVNIRINSPGISKGYWMADVESGGAIIGEACHFVDLMWWLLGSEPIEVSAYSLPAEQLEPRGENNITSSFKFADGSVANLTYCTVGSASSGGERVEIFSDGLGGSVEDFKFLALNGAVRRTRRYWFADKGYRSQLESFVQSVRTGNAPEVTVVDGARATLGCLAMLQAARTAHSQTIDVSSSLTL